MSNKNWCGLCWQWTIGGLVGSLSIGVSSVVLAQVVPDNTLGAESSVVTPDNIQGIDSDRIDNGATRGANLFHSFEQFNIGAGRGAYFSNPAGISNIFSRVTGANRSEILGRLGVLGKANLLLINPRGIIFGPEASLDVQGSFFATTADAVKLGDEGLFSATQPEASNLLTVSPSAILFNTINAPAIVNRSQAQSIIGQPNSDDGSPGLQVQPGQTLGLIGGNVLLDGGNLTAAGGRIELGSVFGVGQVSLIPSGNSYELGYEGIKDFGNILLSNGAFVDVSGEGGGDIHIRSGRLEMTQSSDIWANTLGAEDGGEVLVRSPEVVLSESSSLTADVYGTGGGGNIKIETGRLLVQGRARVGASTYGEGDSGNLQIVAWDSVEVIGTSVNGESPSALVAQSDGSGNAGDLTINTGRLLVQDGVVSNSTFGTGNGASLQIVASDSVEVIGTSVNDSPTGLSAESRGSGDAGDLTINTGRLLVQGGGVVVNNTSSTGDGASLQIVAWDSVEVIGTSINSGNPSGIAAQSAGSGDAGDLTINTGRLLVQDGGVVANNTFGTGNGANLQIVAWDSVEVIGTSVNGENPSILSAQSLGSGDAGDLMINTGHLLVQDGGLVSNNTFSTGNGANLQIVASDSVEVIGTSANGENPSGIAAQSTGSGDAGDLTIKTGRLLVQGGAGVGNGTYGTGNGASLQIVASDSVEVIGTSVNGSPAALSAESQGSGDAGNLTIDTGRLLVQSGAGISSASSGEGTSGNINITARDTLEANNGTIETRSTQSRGGAIAIEAKNIRLSGNSNITSNVASGADDGGSITLTANSILAFDDSDILAFARDGRGGDVTLYTPAFFGENYRPALGNTVPDTLNNNNQVDINATGAVSGTITLPDVSFIQNSLGELPENQLNTDSLLANSCIVRRNQPTRGSFTITGTGGLPQRPGDTQSSSFPTVDVDTLPSDNTAINPNPNRPWQKGDPIVEPQGVYQLPNGKIVLSRGCS